MLSTTQTPVGFPPPSRHGHDRCTLLLDVPMSGCLNRWSDREHDAVNARAVADAV